MQCGVAVPIAQFQLSVKLSMQYIEILSFPLNSTATHTISVAPSRPVQAYFNITST